MSTPNEAIALAVKFHDTYERLAPRFGYETRTETRKFDPETPNGKLMIAVCVEILQSRAAQPDWDAIVKEYWPTVTDSHRAIWKSLPCKLQTAIWPFSNFRNWVPFGISKP
jgi:hypothetical protein